MSQLWSYLHRPWSSSIPFCCFEMCLTKIWLASSPNVLGWNLFIEKWNVSKNWKIYGMRNDFFSGAPSPRGLSLVIYFDVMGNYYHLFHLWTKSYWKFEWENISGSASFLPVRSHEYFNFVLYRSILIRSFWRILSKRTLILIN